MNTCLQCNSDTKSDKASFCSDKCRKAYSRSIKRGETPKPKSDTLQVGQPTRTHLDLSDTDQMFEDYKPGYYTFVGDTRTSNCAICKKGFTTKLKLLRFCSPTCQKQIMVLLAQGLGK